MVLEKLSRMQFTKRGISEEISENSEGFFEILSQSDVRVGVLLEIFFVVIRYEELCNVNFGDFLNSFDNF